MRLLLKDAKGHILYRTWMNKKSGRVTNHEALYAEVLRIKAGWEERAYHLINAPLRIVEE